VKWHDRILVIDDERAARDALAELLRDEGYLVDTASDGADGLAQIDRDPPSLVISDVRMPRMSGLQMVQRMRTRPTTAHLPVILMSAITGRERRMAGFETGADDFIEKPIDFDELRARVRIQLRHVHHERDLERRTLLDPLTGVLNRRGVTGELHHAQARAARDGNPLSVLLVDVDRFKALNDEYGHRAGDTALRQVGRALENAVRTVDRVGRIGGDEFLVIAHGSDHGDAQVLAERLRALVMPRLAVAPGIDITVTFSVGVATLQNGESITELVDRADRDMYGHKHRA